MRTAPSSMMVRSRIWLPRRGATLPPSVSSWEACVRSMAFSFIWRPCRDSHFLFCFAAPKGWALILRPSGAGGSLHVRWLGFQVESEAVPPSPPPLHFQALVRDFRCSFQQINGLSVHDREYWGYWRGVGGQPARQGGRRR